MVKFKTNVLFNEPWEWIERNNWILGGISHKVTAAEMTKMVLTVEQMLPKKPFVVPAIQKMPSMCHPRDKHQQSRCHTKLFHHQQWHEEKLPCLVMPTAVAADLLKANSDFMLITRPFTLDNYQASVVLGTPSFLSLF